MKTDAPTSRDIAARAGVSQATVSRALRNSPLVRPETRERVQRIARELNYFVNRNAAGLRTQQSNTIALLLFDETGGEDAQINPFFLSMIGFITRAAASRGYDILVSLQQLRDDWHIEYEASHRADGLILLGYGDFGSYREKLTALAKANTRFMIWGPVIPDQPGHSIGCDNVSGGYQATRHLLELGHRDIAFFGNIKQSPEHEERFRGYAQALNSAGIDVDPGLCREAENEEARGVQAAGQLLASGRRFDAVFAATDVIAIGAMRALAKAGLRVPADVSVVGFDDIPLAMHVTPAMTTVRQDIRLAGEGLVEGIVNLIETNDVESTLLSPTLIIRESTSPRRA